MKNTKIPQSYTPQTTPTPYLTARNIVALLYEINCVYGLDTLAVYSQKPFIIIEQMLDVVLQSIGFWISSKI